MPAYYDQPASFGNVNVEDVNRFAQLPFYLVKNEVAQFAKWNVFDQLYGEVDWQANQGNIMTGVTPQRSPVGRAFFFPNDITSVPNKDIYQVTESQESARVKLHDYESYQFNFLPSFTAFWKNYIQFGNKDIIEKIAVSNNQFIETNMWFNAQNVYVSGVGVTTGAPIEMGNIAGNAVNSKTNAWLVALAQTSNSNLSLRTLYNACLALQEDFGAPPFEGAKNMPTDNEGLKGKYVIVGSTEAWMNFPFDPDTHLLKSIQLDLLYGAFRGLLFGTTTYKFHRYPIRFSLVDVNDLGGNPLWTAGTPIPPEIYDIVTKKWLPNPYYTSVNVATCEIAWALGADYGRTIKVGPPPREFASTNMSAEKFYSLRWNGEVRLTDQVLIKFADGSLDLNHYGKQLKFISELTHGYLVGERRYAMPIIFRRKRPAAASV